MFPKGVPAEDPHAWVDDCCFLTRMASDGRGSLVCVARVATAEEAAVAADGCPATNPAGGPLRGPAIDPLMVADLAPPSTLLGRIGRGVWRAFAGAWHRLTVVQEESVLAGFGPEMDLAAVPVAQLKLALPEAINSGNEAAAANIAVELTRRREAGEMFATSRAASQAGTAASGSGGRLSRDGGQSAARDDPPTARPGSLWARDQFAREANANAPRAMWY